VPPPDDRTLLSLVLRDPDRAMGDAAAVQFIDRQARQHPSYQSFVSWAATVSGVIQSRDFLARRVQEWSAEFGRTKRIRNTANNIWGHSKAVYPHGNEMQIIVDLQIWFAKCKAALLGDGYKVELAKSPPDRGKPSVSITIASAHRIGELTVWSNGEAELGMGDVDSGMVSEEHREITSTIGLQDATETLIAWVRQAE
jgi:hypothetical protein